MDNHPRARSLRRMYSHNDGQQGQGQGQHGTRSSNNSSGSGSNTGQQEDAAMGQAGMHTALQMKHKRPGQSLTDAAAQAEWANKKWVWVPDPTLGYVAGWIVKEGEGEAQRGDGEKGPSSSSSMATVSCLDDRTRTVPSEDLSKMNPPKFNRVEDIADLTFLNEASVVHNLRERYTAEMIYTYSGPFLVAVNPYRSLPIYGNDAVQLYKSRRREECPPHVFAVAERAWQNMVGEREGQSILITGESGAGKTENTKKVIQYLTAIAAEAAHSLPVSGSASSFIDDAIVPNPKRVGQSEGGELENQIIQANPILEAFGNAQTVRNNNSSRFGKFVRIEFAPSGAIAGATIDWYLLEKSRVTARSVKERNFHVFYQLLRGGHKDLKRDLLLSGGPEDYEYLKNSRLSVEGVDDHEEWRALQHALDVVGMSAAEHFDLFRVVAAILHIGNIAVTADRSEQAYIRDNSALEKVCHLLGLPIAEFTKALLRPRVKAGREWVTQARTKKQVEDEMGALCKAIYEKSFGALVERINRALDRPTSKSTFIGVLDIAGFEIFETNGFEQLCINYTNEKLQQFFNHHMFVLEQEEYARESIDWQFVNFGLDLQPTIDLIESSTAPHIGILSTLDEECIMPKATDRTFTEKLDQAYKQNNRKSIPALSAAAGPPSTPLPATKYAPARFDLGFTISHYAGKVEYRTEGWLDKNKDPLNTNITTVLANSSERYVAALFEEFRDDDVGLADPVAAGGALPSAGVMRKRNKKGAFRTVAQRHKEQLNSLMAQLRDTQPHFVRCIVPNENKRPGQVNVPLVLDQLRCNGVLEGIRIARLGYPNRLPFIEFRQRYEVLTPGIIPKGYMDGRKACQRMTEALELDSVAFRIGLNKIFFKAGVLADLEERRDELLYDIFSRLQARCRRYVGERRFRKQLNREQAIRTVQRNARIYLELKAWPWWPLYTRVRPLLAATRTDEALRRKEAELRLIQERAQRDTEERAKLEQLQLTLESERRRVQDALDSERALHADKDQLLARSKEREAELEDEAAAMQADLDTLDSQLERALASQQAGEARYDDLKAAFDEAAAHVASLEAQSQIHKSREAAHEKELGARTAEVQTLSDARSALAKQLEAAQRTIREREEDGQRANARLEIAQADLQGKLSIILKEKENQSARASGLEDQKRAAEQKLGDLQRSLQDLQAADKRREAEQAALQSQIAALQKQRDSSATELSELRVKLESKDKHLRDAASETSRVEQAKSKLEQEMDALKALVQAKTSEDSKQKEMAAIKEREIGDLRSQITSLTSELSISSRQNTEKMNTLRLEVESAKQQAASASTSLSEAKQQVKTLTSRLSDTERSLTAAEQLAKSSESELRLLRSKSSEVEGQLATIRRERDHLEQRASTAQAKLQSLEDRALQAERDRASWEREMTALGDQLEAEVTKRLQLEKSHKAVTSEIDGLQMRLVEQDQYVKGLRRELRDREAELAKSISLQDKTIVEHVHVLEEAKRYTDKQLSETQARLASITQYSRTLEKTKTRLQAELEDLTVHNERERMDERAMEKAFRKVEEQAEKANKRLQQEERMRQVAEQDVARLTAEVARLRAGSANGASSPGVGGLASNGIQRSKSAFENIPPPSSPVDGQPTVNGVQTKRGLIAELEKGTIYSKDGSKDDALRGRILRELTAANRDLASSMDATLMRGHGVGRR